MSRSTAAVNYVAHLARLDGGMSSPTPCSKPIAVGRWKRVDKDGSFMGLAMHYGASRSNPVTAGPPEDVA